MGELEEALRDIIREELAGIAPGQAREWLTVAEAAEHARCSESTMYSRIRESIVPAHRFEGRLLVSRSELDDTIRALPATATSRAVA